MRTEDRLKNLQVIELTASMHLYKAEFAEWKRYCSIYYHQAVVGFQLQAGLAHLPLEGSMPYWLKNDGVIIGGAAISIDAIRCLFTIPPHQADAGLVRLLSKAIRQLGEMQAIHARDVPTDQEDIYIRAGFCPEPYGYRWMQRPSAEFIQPLNSGIKLAHPEINNEAGEHRLLLEREIGLFLFKHAYDRACTRMPAISFAEVLVKLRSNAARNPEDVLLASSLIYDTATRALIGVCLIGMQEGCPSIDELAVMPSFRGRGLATRMVQRALTILEQRGQPLLRIRVMHGHPIESVCFQLGFMPGPLFLPSMTQYGQEV
ncbi:GNAT family N-acetyltransferase [Paenibacillus sp. HJL G12]|uniref:GNAT family N-acetyltransferase n=1 Tax=Paenibacillus dendrobii TaxID=2691084 RepID=A0A7X3IKD5_9BACL|nr:GNAT family N-acetyltransferase [Paenibacillus dendrobii]MWV43637.1 GNAT family N-acetyltransferase [Paenibacillus dendrobii]